MAWGRQMSDRTHEVGEDVVEADSDGLNGGSDDRRDRCQKECILGRRCTMLIGDPIESGVQTQQQPSHLFPTSSAGCFLRSNDRALNER